MSLYAFDAPLFYSVMGVYSGLSLFMAYFNIIQTYHFETHESIANLLHLNSGYHRPLLSGGDEEQGMSVRSNCFGFYKVGLKSQAIYHGISDAATAQVFMRMFLKNESTSTQCAAVIPVAVFLLIGSAWGNLKTEVKEAISHLREKGHEHTGPSIATIN
jgi:hypothetical protein